MNKLPCCVKTSGKYCMSGCGGLGEIPATILGLPTLLVVGGLAAYYLFFRK